MQIVDLKQIHQDGWKRTTATVIWEKRNHPKQEVYLATAEPWSELMSISTNAFLVGCFASAMYHLEDRVQLEGVACPLLVSEVSKAMDVLYKWYREAPPINLEVEVASAPFLPIEGAQRALMFSGGVDSLANLLANRVAAQPSEPEYFTRGLVISSGFDAFETAPGHWYWAYLEAMAKSTDLELVPIANNLRTLSPSNHFFGRYAFGSLMAAHAHTLSSAVSELTIASGGQADIPAPEGSHPLLDPHFSSGSVQIHHDQTTEDRFDRTALISDWPEAKTGLRVCFYANRQPVGRVNCGECEKCLRTMLTLIALGKLTEFAAFESDDITASYLEQHLSLRRATDTYYVRIAKELDRAGRTDLTSVLSAKLASHRTSSEGLGERLRDIELKYLGGALRRARRRVVEALGKGT